MASFGFGNGAGTEFLSMLAPPGNDLEEYDNTKPHDKQSAPIPQVFGDAMSVREEVYGEQGVPIEAEFDEDDARSWHWVVYASVASTASTSPTEMRADSPTSHAEQMRRASVTGTRLPVGTIRLIPPPHGPNKYVKTADADPKPGDKHADADPPRSLSVDEGVEKKHPTEPYVKLGRLAVLAPYRKLKLGRLLVNTALEYASKHPDLIYHPPDPTTMELANILGRSAQTAVMWQGLMMVHAQVQIAPFWQSYGFAEELVNDDGEVEISKEERWVEEGIEHMAMWKRLKLDSGRL